MMYARTGRLALAALLMLSTGACALLPHRTHWVKVTPTPVAPLAPQLAADEAYYQDAARAITRRDYGRALELLQAARARKADDVRVLNAFGVVYDKLGRFDLSTRYYTQAQALDPSSPIVASNLAYSALLQARATAPAVPTALAQAAPASAPPRTEIRQQFTFVAPGVVRIGADGGLALTRTSSPALIVLADRSPALTGHPLAVINASGRAGATEPLRIELARLGWTAPKSAAGEAQSQTQTTIRYPASKLIAARALARTLPVRARLVACGDACEGLQLIVGTDIKTRNLSASVRRPS
jgi:tetratricopeptide (TPR) repeat protein